MGPKRRLFVRAFEAPDLLELFLVASVSTVLIVRLALHLTGYPSVGGELLHFAHVLWGGLLMLAALITALSFLDRPAMQIAAVAGGIGFGLFVDEIGKFVTRSNDYFFQPAVALIYAVFVVVFLIVHTIHRRRKSTSEEYLLNALKELQELARGDLDMREMERAQEYLSRSDAAHPLVAPLRSTLERIEPLPWLGLPAWRRARSRVSGTYRRLASARGFDAAVIAFFVGQLLIKLAYGAMLIFVVGLGWRQVLDVRFLGRVAERMVELSPLEVAQLAASGLAGWFVLMGVVKIGVSRVAAYRMFERAIVTSILLVQVFSFYSEQFAALVELIFNLTILAFVRAAIAAEEARSAEATTSTARSEPVSRLPRPPDSR
ncbi:MAG TPA: hypothetical protein VFM44_08440 [Gemmatimonadota bacterium]|nr:hypothetical protein [Gemmatimonadota bacterium]